MFFLKKAIKQAQEMKKENGRIMLALTLYNKKSKIMEFLKPKIKFLTTVDFGQTLTQNEVKIV